MPDTTKKQPGAKTRVLRMMNALRAELEQAAGRQLKYGEIAEWAGEAASTSFERMTRSRQPQVEGFLRLLERLPMPTRERLFRHFSKCYPSFEDPALSHDPSQIASLRAVMQKTKGSTVLFGPDPSARAFLATAVMRDIGNRGCGWDLSIPDWFVGADRVIYAGAPLTPSRFETWVNSHWKEITAAPVVLLSGVWLAVARPLRQKIQELGTDRHVVLAENLETVDPGAMQLPAPVHSIRVAGPLHRIHATVRAL